MSGRISAFAGGLIGGLAGVSVAMVVSAAVTPNTPNPQQGMGSFQADAEGGAQSGIGFWDLMSRQMDEELDEDEDFF